MCFVSCLPCDRDGAAVSTSSDPVLGAKVGGVGDTVGGGDRTSLRGLLAVAAWTKWLIGCEVCTNTSVTWSTTESATQRSSSFSFSHNFLVHLSKALLALAEPGSACTAS